VSTQNPGARMWVLWGTDPVEQPAGFDMDAFMAQPQLNDPAFEQRLAGVRTAQLGSEELGCSVLVDVLRVGCVEKAVVQTRCVMPCGRSVPLSRPLPTTARAYDLSCY
jgi:hypothetical protein